MKTKTRMSVVLAFLAGILFLFLVNVVYGHGRHGMRSYRKTDKTFLYEKPINDIPILLDEVSVYYYTK